MVTPHLSRFMFAPSDNEAEGSFDERSHVLLLAINTTCANLFKVFSRDVMKALKKLINWRRQTYIPSIRLF